VSRSPFLYPLLFAVTLTAPRLSAQDWQLPIHAPPYTQVQAEGGSLQGDPRKGEYLLNLSTPADQIPTVSVSGPFGGKITQKIDAPSRTRTLKINSGVIADRNPDPPTLAMLPALCPRLRVAKSENPNTKNSAPSFVYQGEEDRLNHVPLCQMGDPDAMEGKQSKTVAEMDGHNALLLRKVHIRYDYEDANIIDYEGFNAKTGERERIYEGMSGFYSNFHYAVVPYSAEIPQLPRQALLHLARGSLKEIGREDLRPALRTHSFLPGPFLSKDPWNYSLCEWGDTEYQAPEQSLEYEGIALWDWDYSIPERDHLLIIVWEEDEAQELIREKRIPANYLIDDLVAVFEIRRQDTLKPLLLKNPRDDFEMWVQTGELNSSITQAANNSRLSGKR